MAARVTEKKLEEGNALMKEADKLTTKTLTRWKADWESACPIYEKAATCYKNAKVYDKAKQAYKKAAEANKQMNITFSAAKNLEEAGSMAKEEKNNSESAQLYQEASNLYIENGSADKAADTLVKAAKVLEESNPDEAIELCKRAVNIYEVEDKLLYAGQTFKYTTSLMVQNAKWDDVLAILQQQANAHAKLNQTHDLFKMHLSLVIMHLHMDDYVAADKVYQDAMLTDGFVTSAEGKACASLLDAFERRSSDQLKEVLNLQVFNFLDNQIAKLAKKLKMADGLSTGNKGEDEEGSGLA